MITITIVPGFIPTSSELWSNAKFAQLGKPTFVIAGTIGTADLAIGAVTAVKSLPDAYWYAVTTGTATAYVLGLSPGLASLTEGAEIWFRLHADAGVAPTINVNALGAKALVKRGSIAIAAGDFRAGQLVGARYYNNQWQIFSAATYQDVINGGVSTGSGTALAITPLPAFTSYAEITDRVIVFQANATNTGPVTLQVSALAGPKPLTKSGAVALDAADIVVNQWVAVRFDGTNFALISALSKQDNVTAVDAGSTDAYAATVAAVTVTAYYSGLRIWLKCNTKNTGPCTFNLNGIGPGVIKKLNVLDLADNDIQAGQWVQLIHDGSNWNYVNAPLYYVTAVVACPAVGVTISPAHNLTAPPRYMRWVLVNATLSAPWNPGDEVEVWTFVDNLGNPYPPSFYSWASPTLLYLKHSANSGVNPALWNVKCYYAP